METLFSGSNTFFVAQRSFFSSKKLRIELFSTPFSERAVDFLQKFKVKLFKISSFEINDFKLIKKLQKLKNQ